MGYVFLVLMILGWAIGGFLFIKQLSAYGKNKKVKSLDKKQLQLLLLGWIAIGAGGAFMPLAACFIGAWSTPWWRLLLSCLSWSFFFAAFSCLWACFYLYFYRKDTEPKQYKLVKIGLFTSIGISVVAFLCGMELIAPYLTYPLISGFSINGTGFHFFNAQNQYDSEHSGGLSVAWYGVIMVFSALVAYWIGDHRMYKKYGRHGILESTLLVAFPAGVIGARIWYVVGNWEKDGFNTNFWKVFEIWNGGITILGGAFAGILAGALWVIFRRKYVDLRIAIDFVLPLILLSQAIGRFGNFFNLEVYGNVVAVNDGWQWLPTWIQNQMQQFSSYRDIPSTLAPELHNGLTLVDGYINVPLFLIEALLNLSGFFILSYLVPAVWKKHRAPGINMGLYFLWYGIVRIILEPFRNTNFNMGNDGNWSVINAGIYIGIGVVFIIFFEAFYFYRLKKGLPLEIVRGQMPKEKKPQVKKSSLQIVAEATLENEIKPEEKPVENEEIPAKPELNDGENNGN